jgi:hypothetical protein
MTQGREIVPALLARLCSNLRLTIFEMNVPDAIAETAQPIQHDLTIIAAGAVEVVAGIKDQPDQIGVGQVEEASDLLRRLDVARAVMVEGDGQAGGGADGVGNALGPTRKSFPFDGVQAQVGSDAPGKAGAQRVCTVVVGQNDERRRLALAAVSNGSQQARYLQRLRLPATGSVGM